MNEKPAGDAPSVGADTVADEVREALVDVAAEFALNYGHEITEDIRKTIIDYFDKTIQKGITEFGVLWEEPIRSYALKHVGKIGRRMSATMRSGQSPDLKSVADDVIESAREACTLKRERLQIELGPLCPPL